MSATVNVHTTDKLPTFQARRLGKAGNPHTFVSINIDTEEAEVAFFIGEDSVTLFELKDQLADLLEQVEELIRG